MTSIERDDREGSSWVVVGEAKPYSSMLRRLKDGEVVMLVGTKSGTPRAMCVQQKNKIRRYAHPVRHKIVFQSTRTAQQETGILDDLSAEFDQLIDKMQSPSFKQKLDMALSNISSVRLGSD